jgi:hypothetical protein
MRASDQAKELAMRGISPRRPIGLLPALTLVALVAANASAAPAAVGPSSSGNRGEL